jgi:ABC-2 type transport system permease protein
MAVYRHTYQTWTGRRTPVWPRFLILTRYGYARLFQSRFLMLFLVVCLFYPFVCLAFIYLSHSVSFLAALHIPAAQLPGVNGRFFYVYSTVQGALASLLTAFVGPMLVSPDLAHGAMPLYFSRPFSRTEYVAGKMCVLLFLLSLITWIPGLALFVVGASLAGWDWAVANLWVAEAIVLGLLAWLIVLSLIGLALSAWVKWKLAAGALVLGVFFAGAGFGAAINSVLRTHYGTLIDLDQVVRIVWSDLFRYDSGAEIPVTTAWTVLGVVCALCLWLLARRVRAFEVVK